MPEPKYIEGSTGTVAVTVATSKAVAKGDLCGMFAGTLVKASDETWDTDLATTQAAFVGRFVGAAGQAKAANAARVAGNSADNQLAVHPEGVFEFDCDAATFEVGDLVGPAKQAGNALESAKVVAVATPGRAVGRVYRRGANLTRVQVKLLGSALPAAK